VLSDGRSGRQRHRGLQADPTKQGVTWNYAGVRSDRVHLASWAHAGLPLAADLMAGNDDVRPSAGALLARARKHLAEIWGAEDKDHARQAIRAFADAYGAKFAKAVAKVVDDTEELLAFYDYPAEHWIHLRTTNPSRPSPPSGTGPRSPAAPAAGAPAWPWRSSSSRPPRTAGGP